jgi:hypothetical protein
MNRIKTILLCLTVLLQAAALRAQPLQDPTSWTYELRRPAGADAEVRELVFKLRLQPGWHIWSMGPGGDEMMIKPGFTLDENPAVQPAGQVQELGKPVTTTMEGMEGPVTYLSDSVQYVQLLRISGKTRISGRHIYQICNDNMCLPPKEVRFSVETP